MHTDDTLRQFDADRARHIAQGDRDAFEQLVDEFGGAAWSLAVRITREPSVAEEAVQDAFMRVWRYAGSFDPAIGPLDAWVLRLTRTAALDRLRAEARRRPRRSDGSPAVSVSSDDVVGSVPAPAGSSDSDPFAAAWAETQRREVATALAELSHEHREVVTLAYFDGFSQREIADRIGLPIGTVKTRTHRALARLRDVMTARHTGHATEET